MKKASTKRPRRSNAPLNAAGLLDYRKQFLERAQEIADIIRDSAVTLGAEDKAHEITPVLSYVDDLFDQIEERIVKQVHAKADTAAKVLRMKRGGEK